MHVCSHLCIQFAGLQQGQMQGLEAASPPGCRSLHWTVSPKSSCGLDSALTYKGNMNVRTAAAVPVETLIAALKEIVSVGLSVRQHSHALLVFASAFLFLLLGN